MPCGACPLRRYSVTRDALRAVLVFRCSAPSRAQRAYHDVAVQQPPICAAIPAQTGGCCTDTSARGAAVIVNQPGAVPHTVGQKPVEEAKTLGMFRPPESLNGARIERITPSLDSSFEEHSIDRVIRQIPALFNDSGGRNMPRVLAAFTDFWPTVVRSCVCGLPKK